MDDLISNTENFDMPSLEEVSTDEITNNTLSAALTRIKDRAQPAHSSHYTKHTSHSSHSKGVW